jgi:uncharacterized protein
MKVETSVSWSGRLTPKSRRVMAMFGIDIDRLTAPACHAVDVDIEPGQVCFITGPSGGGKSLILRRMYECSAGLKTWVDDVPLDDVASLVDCLPGSAIDSLRSLCRAGLSDVFCVLNQPARLSDGQKWRFRLAMAMAAGPGTIFADEFCSTLDRITASAIAWNVRKWSRRTGAAFVLASCHDDLLADLRPDIVIVKHLAGPPDIIRT